MNPVTFELLNRAERYDRSKQMKSLQLLNRAQAVRPSQPSRFQELVSRLGSRQTAPGQRLEGSNVSPHRQQPHGQAQ